MEHKKGSKQENFIKVRKAMDQVTENKEIFSVIEIQEITKLNFVQCKKYLKSFEELGIIKYSETSKIYMRC